MIDPSLVQRLYSKADAARWSVPLELFQEALDAGVRRALADAARSRRELERHLDTLHLRDLALACACAMGDERAWEHFVMEYRPILYRAADALDRSGGAREVADSLYAELYGLRGRREGRLHRASAKAEAQGAEAGRSSLLRYFHGRSSLATWLRAILAQRYVDRIRMDRRTASLDPLKEDEIPAAPIAPPDPERSRFGALIGRALRTAITRLGAKDRLRLRSYYEQDLTLAQVGRLTGEHEATVSRQLARARKALRKDIEEELRRESHFSDEEIARGWQSVIDDAGPLDLSELFGSNTEPGNARKKLPADRS